jgi:hypothetical protein
MLTSLIAAVAPAMATQPNIGQDSKARDWAPEIERRLGSSALTRANVETAIRRSPIKGGFNVAEVHGRRDRLLITIGFRQVLVTWHNHGQNRVQTLENGFESRSVVDGKAYAIPGGLLIAGLAWGGGNWVWPAACRYRLQGGRWVEASRMEEANGTEASHESGAVPVGAPSHPNPNRLIAWTRRGPSSLGSCHACPHLIFRETWTWDGGRYRPGKAKRIATALAALDDVAGCVVSGSHRRFDRLVPFRFRKLLWHALTQDEATGVRNVTNMADDRADVYDLESSKPIVRVWLVRTASRWHIRAVKRSPES